MEVESLLLKHNVDLSDRPDISLEYVCPNCADFYSVKTAPYKELICEGKRLGFTQLYCDCHGDKTPMSMAVEINTNTPAMEWEKSWLELIHKKLEDEVVEAEKIINTFFD